MENDREDAGDLRKTLSIYISSNFHISPFFLSLSCMIGLKGSLAKNADGRVLGHSGKDTITQQQSLGSTDDRRKGGQATPSSPLGNPRLNEPATPRIPLVSRNFQAASKKLILKFELNPLELSIFSNQDAVIIK